MRKILFLTAVFVTLAASAQRRRIKEPVFDTTPEQAMALYDFDKAEEILEAQIAYLEATKQDTEEKEALLEIVRKNMLKLHSTACITFVDSIVLPKQKVLDVLKLGSECGTLENFSSYFNLPDTMGCAVFVNQLQNKRVYAKQAKGGNLRLFGQELIGNEWTAEKALEGLEAEEGEDMNYPFMLNDGVTLYFAATTEDGLGGYDIFKTRYDTDDHTFLAPENVGMPFNSPANDYLMAIDDYNNLGWFVTDRNQPADTVCLYTFIPSETRRVYNEETVGAEGLRRLARIHSIRETWKNQEEVKQALARLNELRSDITNESKPHDFDFVVNDRHVYTTATDFKNDQARQQIVFWLETKKELDSTETQLASLRQKYATAANEQKQQMAPQIRILEAKAEQLVGEVKNIAKQIRRMESTH